MKTRTRLKQFFFQINQIDHLVSCYQIEFFIRSDFTSITDSRLRKTCHQDLENYAKVDLLEAGKIKDYQKTIFSNA